MNIIVSKSSKHHILYTGHLKKVACFKSRLFTRTAACVLVRFLMLTTDLKLSVSDMFFESFSLVLLARVQVYQKTECACLPFRYDKMSTCLCTCDIQVFTAWKTSAY